jgi:copper chaperone CopZ
MKTTKLITLLIITAAFVYTITGCGKKESEMKDDKTVTENKNEGHEHDTLNLVKDGSYFCPMHPLVQSNEKAKCNICKMDLITKKEHNEDMVKKHEELEGKYAGKPNTIHFEVKLSTLKSWECEKAIKSALKKTSGVLDFTIDLLDSRIHMYIDKSITSKKDVENVISNLGYDANDTKANPEAAGKLEPECK